MMATTARKRTRAGTGLATRGAGLIGIELLAGEAGIHPEVARRLVRLGLIEARGGTRASPLYRHRDAALLARAVRLRRDLGLNYAGAVLACELLARIDGLEQRLQRGAPSNRQREVIRWTPTG
jgi:hypothetical protein